MLDKEYLNIHRKRFENTIDIIKSQGLIKDGDSILSLGCISFFKDFLLESFDVSFVETKTDLRYDIEFNDCEFDFVLCLEVIEHIKDQESSDFEDIARFNSSGIRNLIKESYRVLSSGGSMLVSTPNLHCYKTLYNWIEKKELLTYAPHPRELSQDYLEQEFSKLFPSIDFVYKNSWCGHGVPQEFVEKAEKILDVLNANVENRREDNLFMVCKK